MRVAVDSSVVIAIFAKEPERPRFHRFLLEADAFISAANLVEICRVAMTRFGTSAVPEVRGLLGDYDIKTVPVTAPQVEIALAAMLAYGTGRAARPAVLNFGDLFSYALAKDMDLPLLYKGNDFVETDVEAALP